MKFPVCFIPMVRRVITCVGLVAASYCSVSAQSGTWSGKLDVGGTQLPLVFHLDGDSPTLDSPAQGARGIAVQVERPVTGVINIKIPSIGATFDGIWAGKTVYGTFKQMGVSMPLTLTPGEDKPTRPQTPVAPFPYTQEEVEFANGDALLKGTLVLPEGANRKTPVIIMVTGSGLQNRDEELFEHRPFAVIADALARAGIATLRYDDRGYGESTGDVSLSTTEDFKNDALAGVELLRNRFDRVGVLGHSEGGQIALMIAAEGKCDFIISLAGCVVSGKETLLLQNRTALQDKNLSNDIVDAYCKLLSEAFDASANGYPLPSADGVDIPEALKQNYQAVVAQLRSPYLSYFVQLDMRPRLSTIKCPVLALNGTKDKQVDADTNLGALRSGLSSNPQTRIESCDGLNHLFQHCTTGDVAEYSIIEETFSTDILNTIAQWIQSLK